MTLSAQARADAHEQIRQVAARYSHGVDRLNEAVMKSAYWPDAIDDHGVFVGNAMDFCAMVVASHRSFDSTMHCNFNHLIDITSATRAKGEIYNVGLSEANLSKQELCEVIQQFVPEFVFVEAPVGKDPDQRNYIVSNEKIERTGFKPEYSLERGIQELIKGYTMIKNNQYANI